MKYLQKLGVFILVAFAGFGLFVALSLVGIYDATVYTSTLLPLALGGVAAKLWR